MALQGPSLHVTSNTATERKMPKDGPEKQRSSVLALEALGFAIFEMSLQSVDVLSVADGPECFELTAAVVIICAGLRRFR